MIILKIINLKMNRENTRSKNIDSEIVQPY